MPRKKKEPAFPLFGDLTERKMRSLGDKLDKLQDPNGHKHYSVLSKATDGPVGPLVWHLVHCRLVGVAPQSAGLIRELSENVREAKSMDDILAVLRGLPEDMSVMDKGRAREFSMITPGILQDVDEMLVEAYIRDRDALMAARAELSDNLGLAIDMVRRRAGETIDPASAKRIFDHLIVAHCEQYGLASNCDFPRIVDGERVEFRLADDAAVRELASLFGSESAWDEGLLAWVRPHLRKFRSEPDSLTERTRGGLRLASLGDLIYLFGDGWWKAERLLSVLDARDDAPAALLEAAATLRAEGTAPFRMEGVTILPEEEERDYGDDDSDDDSDGDDDEYGGDEYDEYDDYDQDDYDGGDDEEDEEESLDAEADNDRVRALAEVLTVVAIERLQAAGKPLPAEVEEHFDLERVYDSDIPYALRIRAALGALKPARAHRVIRRIAHKKYYFGKAAAIVDVHFDPTVVEEVLATIDAGDYGIDAGLLGVCGLEIVPIAAAHAAAQSDPKRAHNYREGINYIFARASAAGVDWDPALDQHISVGDIYFAYGGDKVRIVLEMLRRLAMDRYEAILRANIPRCPEPGHLVRCLRAGASEGLVEAVFAACVAAPKTIKHGSFGDDLRRFGGELVAPIRRAIGDTELPGTFMRELERALGPEPYKTLSDALNRKVETPLEELRRLAGELPGPKVRIYLLRRAEGAPAATSVARIGGAAIGLAEADVPRFRDQPMEHILTLDVRAMPGVARAGVGALALFLPDAEFGEHHDAGEVVAIPAAALDGAAAPTDEASALEVELLEVPAAIFGGGDLDEDHRRVRGLVYSSSGYARGGPLWLQDGPAGIDPSFLFQFDESLAYINLGDCGVMYVFDGDITWQCH
ncbi:MAG: hypothetical protein KC486_06540 [Myxococcales bacterium]|nr:hypothetical protein [Myxococcales bacterium]